MIVWLLVNFHFIDPPPSRWRRHRSHSTGAVHISRKRIELIENEKPKNSIKSVKCWMKIASFNFYWPGTAPAQRFDFLEKKTHFIIAVGRFTAQFIGLRRLHTRLHTQVAVAIKSCSEELWILVSHRIAAVSTTHHHCTQERAVRER